MLLLMSVTSTWSIGKGDGEGEVVDHWRVSASPSTMTVAAPAEIDPNKNWGGVSLSFSLVTLLMTRLSSVWLLTTCRISGVRKWRQ